MSVVAEIGISHYGSVALAIEQARLAKEAGFDVVKLQLRTVPARTSARRQSVWGKMFEHEYRARMELSDEDLCLFDGRCRELGICWFASCWDADSVERAVSTLRRQTVKVPSSKLGDEALLQRLRAAPDLRVILSTGMADLSDVERALVRLGREPDVLMHTVSAYPCPVIDVNVTALRALRSVASSSILGYSAHHVDVWPSCMAVALGARVVEHHVTTHRALTGSDQSSSLTPDEFAPAVHAVKASVAAMGDGVKSIRPVEQPAISRLGGG